MAKTTIAGLNFVKGRTKIVDISRSSALKKLTFLPFPFGEGMVEGCGPFEGSL